MKEFSIVILLVFTSLFTSCTGRKSSDPIECYRLWAGEKPDPSINVINGEYWESSHWTKEYTLYLELKAPKSWREAYISQNKLIETKESWVAQDNAPDWFRPSSTFRQFKKLQDPNESAFFEDTLSGKMFIYESQL